MGKFSNLLLKNVTDKSSRIIWAFDPPLNFNNPIKVGKIIINRIAPYISAVKLNRQLVLPLGLQSVEFLSFMDLLRENGLPIIMDAKVNDIGYTNYSIAMNYFSSGFDAIIVNPFIGWEGGVDQIFKASDELDKEIILLAFMSHDASPFGYGRTIIDNSIKTPFYKVFAECANTWNASGVIAGATHSDKIVDIRNILESDKMIFSPGIGAQGGDYSLARKSGMDFGIVGREITFSNNPEIIVKKYIEKEKNFNN
ncbi:MAG: Orotidine 5'-phosphate decarboxylase [Candidatus Heimdallarchaeota archaeon LC_3]|nr:MAG: Orotidine 5'-phosphate decarboxylase [Candidatus Heimdallarchaeota archaeon LC_3]